MPYPARARRVRDEYPPPTARMRSRLLGSRTALLSRRSALALLSPCCRPALALLCSALALLCSTPDLSALLEKRKFFSGRGSRSRLGRCRACEGARPRGGRARSGGPWRGPSQIDQRTSCAAEDPLELDGGGALQLDSVARSSSTVWLAPARQRGALQLDSVARSSSAVWLARRSGLGWPIRGSLQLQGDGSLDRARRAPGGGL